MAKTLYNVLDWYWAVAGDPNVWSSARTGYFATSDATYLAWLADDPTRIPKAIDSAALLGGVMQQDWLPQALKVVQVQSTGTPALNGTYAIDTLSQAQITGISAGIAAGKGLPGGGGAFFWPDVTGVPHSFNSANFLNFASGIEAFLYSFTQALGATVAGFPTPLPTQPITIA